MFEHSIAGPVTDGGYRASFAWASILRGMLGPDRIPPSLATW